jgi:hypothetical protein
MGWALRGSGLQASSRKCWRRKLRKRLTMASASCSGSRSSVLSSEGRTSLPGHLALRALAQLVRQAQPIRRCSASSRSRARSGRAGQRHQALQPRRRALFAHAVLQRQRTHAVHDGKGAQLLQVQRLLVALGGQALNTVAGLLKLVGRGRKARQVLVLARKMRSRWARASCSSWRRRPPRRRRRRSPGASGRRGRARRSSRAACRGRPPAAAATAGWSA